MNVWKCMLAASMTLCLAAPAGALADGEVPDDMVNETPSFQNAAQAQRAANIAEASFSELDQARAEAEAAAEAAASVEQISTAYAEGVVDKIASDYAFGVVEEKAAAYAEGVVADEYPVIASAE